jgi:hypothetical protein
MDYMSLGKVELNELIDDKRRSLNDYVERHGVGVNVTPTDELLTMSRELDELINIYQARFPSGNN